ncbi:MAG: hypothetical protein DWQ36_21360 [Acidobacteria bacterium]|nr:MAG: hypothetical protein DWQ36_21360 [Acidobacteriota bacterium]
MAARASPLRTRGLPEPSLRKVDEPAARPAGAFHGGFGGLAVSDEATTPSPRPIRRGRWSAALGALLVLFTLFEVNYPVLRPQSDLAIFALFGLLFCFLFPRGKAGAASRHRALRLLDYVLAGVSTLVCVYVIAQTEPSFSAWWLDGSSLGDRAGAERPLDYLIGALGLVVVLEGARRSVGWALPILSVIFLIYAQVGPSLPTWLFPHRGYGWERIVSQTFLHSQGVFGTALSVMFTYVFLFVVFGALLERTGATQFVIDAAQRIFAGSVGGAAKVSVLSSGLMGSLSGSAVANTATTGTFTIPLMRSSGFKRHEAAGIEAAASSGGALVPPVMGAGAYMMLEIVDPPVTYLEIVRAALLPSLIYYFSLFTIVHFVAHRVHWFASRGIARPGRRMAGLVGEAKAASSGAGATDDEQGFDGEREPAPTAPGGVAPNSRWAGVLFVGSLTVLIGLLLMRFSVFRAVTVALIVVAVLAMAHGETRLGLRDLLDVAARAARGSVALICAAASVGVVIGVVTLTGIGTKLPSVLLPLAEQNLMAALTLIMISSIVLGMGLPSAGCYLLMATLIGPVLGNLGVVPLAAHLFIFYFGMMSMVTPPVALAAYTAASIADAGIMRSGIAAFRFALVGFTLPYLFVLRPELLLMSPEGGAPPVLRVVVSVIVAIAGIVPLAAAISGYLRCPIGWQLRLVCLAISGLLLWPAPQHQMLGWNDITGFVLLMILLAFSGRLSPGYRSASP